MYSSPLTPANYYTHIGVAFAARMVIRLTSLLPSDKVGDVHQTARDLESVTHILAQGESLRISYLVSLSNPSARVSVCPAAAGDHCQSTQATRSATEFTSAREVLD